MILNGFTDQDGWLHWYRRGIAPDVVRRARPAELFHQNHLYSTLSESGVKDPAMERFLSMLEGEAVGVVETILNASRADRLPVLSNEQKYVWYMFFLIQWRRTPETQRANTSDIEALRMVDDIVDRLRESLPHRRHELDALTTDGARERIVRNVRVQTLIQFSKDVMGVLERRGITILRIRKRDKRFIVGSRPVVKITTPGHSDLNDPVVEMWLPISSDVAVGVGRGGGGVNLLYLDKDKPIRQLNLAIAGQSTTIAAGSAALIKSLTAAR